MSIVDGELLIGTGIDQNGFISGVAKMTATAATAAATITATLSAAAVKIGSEFEASLSQVAATMGTTAGTEAYNTLSEAAKEMGANTQFSASQAAEALNYLALAGYDAEKSVAALPTVLNVAAAGGMELASASDMITDAMSALGLEMSDMSTFADQLAVTAQKSNTSVAQLGEAILTVGGTAKTLSGGVTEMNTALGILADNGIKGAEGGTALRNVILSLSAPTNTAAAALEGLGVSAFDASGTMRPLEDTFGDLNAALSTLSDQEKTAVLNEIFNKVDLKSVNALLGTSSERFQELSGYISDCSGAAEQMAATMNDNLQGDLTIMQSALEGLGIAAYEKFEQPLRTAVQNVTSSIGDLTESVTNGELSDSFDKIAAAMSDLAGSAAKLVADDILPAAINSLAWIVDNGQTLVNVLGMAAAGVAAYKLATEGATLAQAALNATVLVNPFGLLLAAVSAAGVGLIEFFNAANKYEESKVKVDETTQAIRDQTAAYEKNLRAAYENMQEAKKNAEATKAYWEEVQNLVDENGNATGSTEELKAAVDRLNEVSGMNIELIDGQIQGYKDLSLAMADNIEMSRIAAQKSYLQDSYAEALFGIKDVQAQIEDVEKAWAEADEAYKAKVKEHDKIAAGWREGLYTDDELWDAQWQLGEAEEAWQDATGALNELRAQEGVFQNVIDEYEGLKYEEKTYDPNANKTTAQLNAERYAENCQKADEETAKNLADIQTKTTESIKEAWEQAEHDYAVGTIKSEEELYDKKKEIWRQYGDESNKDHWKYIEDIKKYDKDYAEDQIKQQEKTADELKKLQEQEIEDKIAAVKLKKDLNDDFTEEMMYDEIETIISGLGEESEIYQRYNTEILRGRKKLADDMKAEAEKQSKELKTTIGKDLDSILSEYQKAFNELENKRQSYKQKLMSVGGSLFSVNEIENEDGSKTKQYTVNNIDEQIKKIREYHAAVKNLKDRNVSDALLSELTSMSSEDSAEFAKQLSKLSDDELAKINDLYNEKDEIADELSKDFYSKEAQNLSDSFKTGLVDISQNYGKEAADNYIDAFKAAFEDRHDEISSLLGDIGITDIIPSGSALSTMSKTASDLTAKRDNIKSAAPETSLNEGVSNTVKESDKVTEAVEDAFDGVPESAYQYGEQAGEAFWEGFRNEFSRLYEQFAAEQLSVSAAITAGQTAQGSYGGSSWSNSKTEKIVIENRDEITVKVDKDVLGKTVYNWTKEHERRTNT